MKVVHIISGGDIGGAKTHIEMLLGRLNAMKGIEVSLLCVIDSALLSECRRRGVNVKIIPQKTRSDLSAVYKMAKWINNEGFDIIHCHGARANFIALFLRLYVKKPMVTTIHSDYKLDFKGDSYKNLIYTPLNAFSLRRFKHFITLSKVFKEMLIERGFKDNLIDVIYNGIDFEHTPKSIPKKEFLASFSPEIHYDEDTVIIGCVTRLHPVKGVDILLKACTLLFENNVNALVLIAGSGDEMQGYQKYIDQHGLSNKVRLLGHIKDINSFYGTLDINILPSISEAFGLTLIEGAKYKLATIASQVGGVPEIIKDGETGQLFPVGDYKALAKLILDNIVNKKEGMERGERLYKESVTKFSDVKMAESHIDVYKSLKGEKNEVNR